MILVSYLFLFVYINIQFTLFVFSRRSLRWKMIGMNIVYLLLSWPTMQRLYRGWRNRLHDLYKKFRTDEERLANIPEDVTPEDWKYMMAHFSSDAFQVFAY